MARVMIGPIEPKIEPGIVTLSMTRREARSVKDTLERHALDWYAAEVWVAMEDAEV